MFSITTLSLTHVHGTSALQTDRQTTYDSNTALCITCIARYRSNSMPQLFVSV